MRTNPSGCVPRRRFMKTTEEANSRQTNELRLELKYCERCGSLWLRPGEGDQRYCAPCAQVIAELPPPSREPRSAGTTVEVRFDLDDIEFEGYEPAEGVEMVVDTTIDEDMDAQSDVDTSTDPSGGVA
jgi:hypothetical protein